MDTPPVYVIDTSSLVALHHWRPPGKNRAVWRRLDDLIGAGRLIAPDEVYDELRAGDDALSRWAHKRRSPRRLFKRTTHRHAGIAKQIIHRFPDFVERDRPIPQADPFVVALAVCEAESEDLFRAPCIVVTEEKYSPTGRPRIPHVCEAHRLRYLSIHQMYVHEGWML